MMNFLYGILLCFFVSAVAETTSTLVSVHEVEEDHFPNGHSCRFNSACRSKWCEGGNWFSKGVCKPKIPDGQIPFRGDRESCQSGEKVCNVCGHKMNFNAKCIHSDDCKSGYCLKLDVGHCSGRCAEKIPDGQIPLNGDQNSCQSGRKVCNTCGHTVDVNGECNFDRDCKSGNCSNLFHNWRCVGRCLPRGEEGESDEDNFLEISDDQETSKHLRAA